MTAISSDISYHHTKLPCQYRIDPSSTVKPLQRSQTITMSESSKEEQFSEDSGYVSDHQPIPAPVIPKPKPLPLWKRPITCGWVHCMCECSKGSEKHTVLTMDLLLAPGDAKKKICGGCYDRIRMGMGDCG